MANSSNANEQTNDRPNPPKSGALQAKSGSLQVMRQTGLPQNRPIAPNNTEDIDQMMGYLD